MGDFLGSYYDSGDLYGSDLDEKVISQRMALLNAEQPISILDMEHLESTPLPTRLRDVDALNQPVNHPSPKLPAKQDALVVEHATSLEDDLEIPVASMSTFEQGAPSMVSVQLLSVKEDGLVRKPEHTNLIRQRQIEMSVPQAELEYDTCSPLSAAKLLEAQMRPRRKFTVNVDEREGGGTKNVEKVQILSGLAYNELVENEERAARAVQTDKQSLKTSLFRLLGKSRKK